MNVIKGTMKVHSVVGLTLSDIMVRDTTCVCEYCFTHRGFVPSEACGWKRHMINKGRQEQILDSENDNESTNNMSSDEISDSREQKNKIDNIKEGDFVAGLYDEEIYVGRVVDCDDGQYEVTFMEHGSKIKDCLKWPKNEDKIWIEAKHIVCKVDEPIPTGRGKRMFKLSEVDGLKIKELDKH